MKRYLVLYGAGGYDGDDDFCYGNADWISVREDRKTAEVDAQEEANKLAEEFFPSDPYIEDDPEYGEVQWRAAMSRCIDIEEHRDAEGILTDIEITHRDEMFPHHAVVRVAEIDV